MIKNYTVHSAHDSTVQSVATLIDGSTADVKYAAFIVELVPSEHDSGSWKLEFHGAEIPWAREHFVPGSTVTFDFSSLTFVPPVDGNDN